MEKIAVKKLTKDYGNHKGIFGVDFSVMEGEVFGFLGPNGAGKTTTIRHLMGFIRPDSGEAAIEGMDCFKHHRDIQKNVGYLPGEISLMDDMTGSDYLNFIGELKCIRDRGKMKELISRFELDPSNKIRKMSKGTKQKLALICAFMQEPGILLLDEPTSGLDPLMQNRFVELILEEKQKGTTILLSSHVFEEVEKTCDRTAIIRQGELVDIEDMKAMAEKRKKLYTVTFQNPSQAERFAEESGLRIKETEGSRVRLTVSGQPGPVLEKIAQANPLDLDVKTQTLEELFLHYYGEEEAK